MNDLPPIEIAIVDDHTLVRQGLKSMIHCFAGFNVCIEAGDGRELIDKFDRAASLPHVCLIDINMEGMDGFETMREVNKKWPQINCIALSMHSSGEVILRMLKYGARDYLTKNCTTATLIEAITEVHINQYYFSDLVLKKFPEMSPKNIKDYARKALNEKQIEFLSLCCSDLSYEEIGEKMGVSRRTAEKYCGKLRDELNIHSRAELVMYALHIGIGKINKDYE